MPGNESDFDHHEPDDPFRVYLRSLIAGGPSTPEDQRPAPVPRDWRATTLPTQCLAGKIVQRHPELVWPEFAQIKEMVLGRPPRGVTRGRQGFFHSQKTERTLFFRSRLEFDLIRQCEFDPAARFFVEHPVRLRYQDSEGRTRHHIPDLYVRGVSGSTFYEVKWEEDASRPENEARWPAIGTCFAELGFSYSVITERTLRTEPKYSNLTSLFRARRAQLPDPHELNRLLEHVKRDRATISELQDRFPAVTLPQVYKIILCGLLAVDLNLKLGPETEVQAMEVPYETISL